MVLINIFMLLVFITLAFWAAYYLVFAILGRFLPARKFGNSPPERNISVFLPAYKEDAVIVSTARQAAANPYPYKKIVVIADSLKPETLKTLRQIPVSVVEVQFEKSTKAKAINRALECMDTSPNVALVLDADNVMADDFLFKINDAFAAGEKVVQGHRIAKNTNTPFAMLDACSEEINNHIFRKAHVAVGLSSALIGSGMAFDYHLFREIMQQIQAVGGFDKELELRLLKKKVHFAYAEDALVYDEKVQSSEVFQHQRKRWLSAQWHYFSAHFTDALLDLFRTGNMDYFNKALQNLQIPRLILLGITTILALVFWFFPVYPAPFYWLAVWLATVAALVLAMPNWYLKKSFWLSLLHLPRAFLRMFLLLFRLKGANKSFIHTPHDQH